MQPSMNDDIQKYPCFMVYNKRVMPANWIKTTADYNHGAYQLHHYIKQQSYNRNKEWYKERNIEQKLFLLPIQCHLDLHSCISNFEEKWGIPRKELLYGAKF